MQENLNYCELKPNDGYLVPVYGDDGNYRGMRWVSESDFGKYIDLDSIEG